MTANTNAIWQHAAHTTDQLTSRSRYKKAYLLTRKNGRIFGKKFRRMDQQAEKDKTERIIVLGRRTREETAKWNQMTALRFQTKEETPEIPGLPSGAVLFYTT